MRSAWPGPSLWDDMQRFATAIRRVLVQTRWHPGTAAIMA